MCSSNLHKTFLTERYPNDTPSKLWGRFESLPENPKLFNDLVSEMIIGSYWRNKYMFRSIYVSEQLSVKIYTTVYQANKQNIDREIYLRNKQAEKEAIEDSFKKDKEAREEKKKKELEILQEKKDDSIYYSTPQFMKTGLSQFQTPPEFPGGLIAFQRYIDQHLNRDVTVINKAPSGKYTVNVIYTIDIDGGLKDIKPLNNPGYGTKEEVIRVLENCPMWIPASEKGHKVKVRREQYITFYVAEE